MNAYNAYNYVPILDKLIFFIILHLYLQKINIIR
jgi:hypothetical protein